MRFGQNYRGIVVAELDRIPTDWYRLERLRKARKPRPADHLKRTWAFDRAVDA